MKETTVAITAKSPSVQQNQNARVANIPVAVILPMIANAQLKRDVRVVNRPVALGNRAVHNEMMMTTTMI
jgi:hypothetical protein